jgi:two-component system sensor histidine kinase/response regulator
MKQHSSNPEDAARLRQQAEELLKKQQGKVNPPATEADMLKLIHELQVHRVELEMQNEELLEARAKAELAENKYVSLYDFAPSGYFTLNKEGDIMELNLAGAKMLGSKRKDIINRRFTDFIAGITRNAFNDFLAKTYNGLSQVSCEVVFITDSGTTLYAILSGSLAGDTNHCLITAADITGLKLAEKKIESSNEKLLTLNATKDKFFSIIAHDLRSPFSSIMGYCEVLVEQVREKNYNGIENNAGIILQASGQAMDLLMNLMEWARSQTGRIEFSPMNFELDDLINENLNMFGDIAGQKSVSIKKVFPDNIRVFADKPMISTVLRNLISNAIKFTGHGGEIIISTENRPKEIVVSVSDNGAGISRDRIEKLFRIDQSDSTPGTDNENGTGLGLILCKEFVEKHGGRIRVQSEEGKGSIFTFTLPDVS